MYQNARYKSREVPNNLANACDGDEHCGIQENRGRQGRTELTGVTDVTRMSIKTYN